MNDFRIFISSTFGVALTASGEVELQVDIAPESVLGQGCSLLEIESSCPNFWYCGVLIC
jgi:hypothetical protein